MKKNILLILLLVFGMTFVYADSEQGAGIMGNNNSGSGEQNAARDFNEGLGEMIRARIGEHIGPQGQEMHLEMLQNRFQLRVGNSSADCDCNLTQEQGQNRTRLYAGLSNGRNAEIKIMPDRASETALQQLRLRNCIEEEGCQIELKEVGKGEATQLAYELKTQKKAKFLGIFGTQMKVQAQVNAENGEVIRVNKPWWAFLASEENEIEE